jgi:hypothetical protein
VVAWNEGYFDVEEVYFAVEKVNEDGGVGVGSR